MLSVSYFFNVLWFWSWKVSPDTCLCYPAAKVLKALTGMLKHNLTFSKTINTVICQLPKLQYQLSHPRREGGKKNLIVWHTLGIDLSSEKNQLQQTSVESSNLKSFFFLCYEVKKEVDKRQLVYQCFPLET